MAHFAQLDENGVVINVITVANTDIVDENNVESEALGVLFCKNLCGQDTNWVQTSYNGSFRKNYAAIGYQYDSQRDAFVAPQPFPSWILNEMTCVWEAPTPYPQDGNFYNWDETTTSWVPYDNV